jgi:uncharacterized protein
MRPARDWINTYTGRKFWPVEPYPDEIDIRDIAHALSMQCRFTGHSRVFYSVAQHCIHVSEHCDEADRLWGLLHDAAEAYLVDLARPVKHQPALKPYRDAEHKIMAAVVKRFDLTPEQPESVTIADHRMLTTEAQQLMNQHPDWLEWSDLGEPYPTTIRPMSPADAEAVFLGYFYGIVNGN